ncbi:RNA-dependent ATPase ROK1 [Sugiyamaella lignohabitans]|uniref:RNA helicase n=1 Tax=Sugiyamaella lignohabitans TaxID=796027 RepID=A0A161HKX2_9ASCO|nr:RNA-dependent ATPase ROK1 [Sugiyamaella lignohabitans]ANB13807.1 RNA-dependent ATPase ROK1 [Sugiyamaella lignohabitans]
MDIFKLLSRGATIQRNGKHQKDLELFNPNATAAKEVAAGSDSVDLKIAKEIDFFKNASKADKKAKKVSSETNNKDKKVKQSNKNVIDNRNDEDDEEDDAVSVPLSITSPEEASVQRKKFKIKTTGDDIPLPIGSFEDLTTRFQLHRHLLRNLEQQNFSSPTAIQSESIPILLHGRDLIACAPTGSGKTLAFSIPLVQSLKEHKTTGIRCLIVSPTKELATQIYNEVVKLSRGRDLNICILTKAAAAKFRNDALSRQKFDILITTPLRLVDAVKSEIIDLSHVQHLVLDEADKLFEQGFLEQTDDILAACSNPRLQKALFSATIPSGVEEMAKTIMHSPIRIIVGHKEGASHDIDQKLVYAGNEQGKLIAIRQMITGGEVVPPVIIFVQSIQRAKALFHELLYDKVNVDAIHGERTQNQRDKVIERFKQGEIWVLICTDVLSRGIDFRGVNLVINYDVPQSSQSYVHRIGRTGRAGRAGKAVTFFTKDDHDAVKNVVNVMKQSGCDVGDWMLKMKKITKNDKKQLKKKPVERTEISTVPSVIRQKRKQRRDMVEASKKRKLHSTDDGPASAEQSSDEASD